MSDLEDRLQVALREVAEAGPDTLIELPLAPVRRSGGPRITAVVGAAAVTAAAVLGVGLAVRSARDDAAPAVTRGVSPIVTAHPSPDPSVPMAVVTDSPSDSLRVVAGAAADFANGCPTGAEYGLTFAFDVHLKRFERPGWDVAQATFALVSDPPTTGVVRVARLDVRLRTLADLKGEAVPDGAWVVQWPLANVPRTATDDPVPLSRTVVLTSGLKLLASYTCYQYGMNGAHSAGIDVPPLVAGDTFDPRQNAEWIVSSETPVVSRTEAIQAARHLDGGPTWAPSAQLVRYTNWAQGPAGGPLNDVNRLVWLLQYDGVDNPYLGGPAPASTSASQEPSRPTSCKGTETIPISAMTGHDLGGIWINCGGHVYQG
jgi:hypothetical protein